MRSRIIWGLSLILALGWSPELRAEGNCEALGKVLDAEGKPVVGAVVTFTNPAFPKTPFSDKTDRKGGFWFPTLLYSEQSETWKVTISAEGYHPVKAKVESRLANRTLLGQRDFTLGPGNDSVEVLIKAFGTATLEFTMAPGGAGPPAPAAIDVAAETAASAAAAAAEEAKAADPFAEATAAIRAGNLEGSVEHFRKAIEEKPDDAERREVFAGVLLKLDRTTEAESAARKAAELAPDRLGPVLIQADIAASRGDYAGALVILEKRRSTDPENPRVLERIGQYAAESKQIDKAISAYEALTRVSPEHAVAWMSLGGLYNDKQMPAKAEEAFRKVVELDPANAYKTFFNIGIVIENRPDLSEADNRKAVEAFRKSTEAKPDYSLAHRHLAYALLRAADIEGALKELKRYLELDPKAADAAEIRETVRGLESAGPTKKR